MQKYVQAIWQGQNDDNQVEAKDRFVVVSYMADLNKATVACGFLQMAGALLCCRQLYYGRLQQSNCCEVFLLVVGVVMCCCSEDDLKSTKLVYFAEILNDIFGEVQPWYKMYYEYVRENHGTHGQNYLAKVFYLLRSSSVPNVRQRRRSKAYKAIRKKINGWTYRLFIHIYEH